MGLRKTVNHRIRVVPASGCCTTPPLPPRFPRRGDRRGDGDSEQRSVKARTGNRTDTSDFRHHPTGTSMTFTAAHTARPRTCRHAHTHGQTLFPRLSPCRTQVLVISATVTKKTCNPPLPALPPMQMAKGGRSALPRRARSRSHRSNAASPSHSSRARLPLLPPASLNLLL